MAYPISTDIKADHVAAIATREAFVGAILDPTLPGAAAFSTLKVPTISAEPQPWSAWNLLASGQETLSPRVRPASPGTIFGTSGSTGVPKTVQRLALPPDLAQCRNARFKTAWGMKKGMRTVVTGPLYHQAPLYWMIGAFEVADLMVVQRRFDALALLELIQRHRITHLHLVPRMFRRLLDLPAETRAQFDVSSLEFVLHGAGPTPVADKREMLDWWKGAAFREYYSTSEFGIISLSDIPDFLERPTSVGRPFEGVEVEIRDPESGTPVPVGALGQIHMRSDDMPPFFYSGADGRSELAQTGDFVTVGDMGFFDDDGFLHLTGRRQDKAVIAGVNFFSRPIEEALAALPYVYEAAVVPVADQRLGQAFVAYIVLRKDTRADDQQVLADLHASGLDRLAIPRTIAFVPNLPRTDAGKTFRADLELKGVAMPTADIGSHSNLHCPLSAVLPAGISEVMLEETESTNKDALAQASAGAPHLTLVWAKRQTKGRGRGGRVWRSGEGNVFYSLLLRPEPDWGDFNHLPYVTALAVHAALRPLTPAERSVTLKWPNDVLIDGAKVSGTLIEADNIRRVDGKLTADAVIVGIGVNVIDHPTDGLIYPATNLRHVGSASERQHVIAALSASLIAAIDLWRAQGFAVIRDAYMARAYGLHKRITVRVSTSLQDAETGEFTGVDDDGALQLKLDDGSVRKVFAGDVFFPT